MFKVGQEVCTRYGAGVVVCVGRVKPTVYVRVHARPHGIFMLSASDVRLAAATPADQQIPDPARAGIVMVGEETRIDAHATGQERQEQRTRVA
jgi:hypothetical protein